MTPSRSMVAAVLALSACQGATEAPKQATVLPPTTLAPTPAPSPIVYRYVQGGGGAFFPLAPGSTGIHISVNKETGSMTIGGLKFTKDVVLNVWKDGTLEADQEGLEVEGADGHSYVMRRTKVGNKEGIVFVRK